jgi:hypothetical protein
MNLRDTFNFHFSRVHPKFSIPLSIYEFSEAERFLTHWVEHLLAMNKARRHFFVYFKDM